MDQEALRLAEEIEASRREIEKLQERVRLLVARRGKRAELVKSTAQLMTSPDLPTQAANVGPATARSPEADIEQEFTLEEGLAALKSTPMSDVRLIAFKHGAIVFLFNDEKTMAVRMDDRGPKPLLDLLTANDRDHAKAPRPATPDQRPRV